MTEFWVRFKGGKWHAASCPWKYQDNQLFVTECKRSWSYRKTHAAEVIDDPSNLPHHDNVCKQPACQREWNRLNV